MTTHYLKQCRPDAEETEYFWKLFHAAQRNDTRGCGSTLGIIAEDLSCCPNLERKEKLFLLRAWQVLVDDKGGFGRFMGAFDTYVYNMQDPDDDCVAWKPELSKLLMDGSLFGVVLDAYREAHQRIAELESRIEAADKLQDSTFRHGLQHGWSYCATDDKAGFEACMAAYGPHRAAMLNGGKP